MIEIQSLTKRYKDATVVNIEQLSIGSNESFGLVGNNGAGKTTLFRMILDLVKATSGTITNAADLKSFLEKFEVLFHGEITGKNKYIGDLSKGNLKKVGIAASFIGNPQIIMLDEPFENLDPTSQIRLKELLQTERKLRQVTYLISSHDLNHVTDICERIVLLEKGQVIKDLRGESTLAELEAYFKA
jgi:ABC-2 type transport system ATP-binding protein